jgi:hypothetical protein
MATTPIRSPRLCAIRRTRQTRVRTVRRPARGRAKGEQLPTPLAIRGVVLTAFRGLRQPHRSTPQEWLDKLQLGMREYPENSPRFCPIRTLRAPIFRRPPRAGIISRRRLPSQAENPASIEARRCTPSRSAPAATAPAGAIVRSCRRWRRAARAAGACNRVPIAAALVMRSCRAGRA